MREVTSVVDNRDLRSGDPLREFVGVGTRNHRIGLPPNDQGRRGNTVDPPFEALVRDRPDKFPGAGL